MAKETIIKLLDDLDGGAAQETVTFGLDGQVYTIDLSTKNAKKLRSDLAAFVDAGTRVPGGGGRVSGRRAVTRVVGDKDENRAVREWAQTKGFDVAARGRIKQDIVEAYHRAGGR